jgi:APA family basic amino acid/polyamine antiporter
MAVSHDGWSHGMFAVKPADAHLKEVEENKGLKRSIGLLDLTALGLGAIIGTGIFVILGEAIGDSCCRSSWPR